LLEGNTHNPATVDVRERIFPALVLCALNTNSSPPPSNEIIILFIMDLAPDVKIRH